MGKKQDTQSSTEVKTDKQKKLKKQVAEKEEKVIEEEQAEEVEEQQEETQNDNEQPDHLNRSVFVSGLPYSVDEDQIKEFFAKCGTIENLKLPRYQDTGKIIGYSHVIFSTPQEAQKALKLNKSMMGTRYLDISISKGEKKVEYKKDIKPPTDCTTIFVKNIAFDATEDEVGQLFEKCGKVENVRFVYHPHQKHFKGFAFVDFKMNSSVNAAMKMNGVEFKNRKLMIDFEVGSMKKGFRFKKTEEGNTKYNQQYEDLANEKEKKIRKDHKFDKLKNFSGQRNSYSNNKYNDSKGGYSGDNGRKSNGFPNKNRGHENYKNKDNLKLFGKKKDN